MKHLFNLLFLILFFSCADSSKQDTPETTSHAPAAGTPIVAEPAKTYPSISVEFLQNLWNETDFVDYTFYELPVSMSFDTPPSIQNLIRHISSEPATIPKRCKPNGRAYFQKQGNDLAVVEFYILNNCNYYVFIEDGKPKYANVLTQEGIEFYKKSLGQAMGQMKQRLQNQNQ